MSIWVQVGSGWQPPLVKAPDNGVLPPGVRRHPAGYLIGIERKTPPPGFVHNPDYLYEGCVPPYIPDPNHQKH